MSTERKKSSAAPKACRCCEPKADVAALDDLEEAMRDVVDPELGINVVDLGLVYDIRVDEENIATIDMTLTSAACPLTDVIEDQTRAALTGGRAAAWSTTSASTGCGCRRGARRRSPTTAASSCARSASPSDLGFLQRRAPLGVRAVRVSWFGL